MFAYASRTVFRCALIMAVSLTSGCSNYIFETFDIDDNDSLSIDAKQRLVLNTHEGGKTRDRKIVCAEPSPDAIAATSAAASGGGAFTIPGAAGEPAKQAELAAAFQRGEAVGSIGMRTQTIQLLRDGLYRACEAYMNGAIDQFQYNIILTNVNRMTITLLGIDAIGGTQRAPAVTIASNPGSVKTNAPGGDNPPSTEHGEGTSDNEIEKTTAVGCGAADNPCVVALGEADKVKAEAIANVILAANAVTSTPTLCISLLASGEMRVDNPGQKSVLKSCDYILQGGARNLVNHPNLPPSRYRMTTSENTK